MIPLATYLNWQYKLVNWMSLQIIMTRVLINYLFLLKEVNVGKLKTPMQEQEQEKEYL